MIITFTESSNFIIVSGCLLTKLITWEVQNFKALFSVRTVQPLQLFILRGETSGSGAVNNQQNFTIVNR